MAKTTITKSDLEFLPLEDTDPIRQRFEAVFADRQEKQGVLVSKRWEQFSEFTRDISETASIFFPNVMYLFFQVSDKVGALSLDSRQLLMNAPSLLEIDGDSIYACNGDMSCGLVLDKFEEDGYWIYEAFVWGDELKAALLG
ncbi:hypothetical protein [Candidatus Thiosymbion oneisti]|uniref:hypothetical protein n=1 Tax=Candidatus Thiosymbion oneisti TaxID=589554 RepID=UPI000B7FF191|nr:hypothetical protein [Candidatus Thiosymbion oneisti]